MDLERSNLLNIIRIKDMRTELKSKDGIQKQLFLIDGEIVFHPCFDCVYKALQISSYRNNALILAMPENIALVSRLSQDPAWKKLIMNSIGVCIFPLAHSVVRVRNVLFSMSLISILNQLINHLS